MRNCFLYVCDLIYTKYVFGKAIFFNKWMSNNFLNILLCSSILVSWKKFLMYLLMIVAYASMVRGFWCVCANILILGNFLYTLSILVFFKSPLKIGYNILSYTNQFFFYKFKRFTASMFISIISIELLTDKIVFQISWI